MDMGVTCLQGFMVDSSGPGQLLPSLTPCTSHQLSEELKGKSGLTGLSS